MNEPATAKGAAATVANDLDGGEAPRYYLLGGTVKEGMFPEEAAVSFSDGGGRAITTFVSRTLLRRDAGGRERLLVHELARGDGFAVVAIPGEVYGATRGVAVGMDILEPVAGP